MSQIPRYESDAAREARLKAEGRAKALADAKAALAAAEADAAAAAQEHARHVEIDDQTVLRASKTGLPLSIAARELAAKRREIEASERAAADANRPVDVRTLSPKEYAKYRREKYGL